MHFYNPYNVSNRKKSLNKIYIFLKLNYVSLASVDDVKLVTGYTIGGVSPIGHLNKVDIYIDNSLKRFNSLFAAAGHPNCIFKTNFEDLEKITNGKIEELIEWNNPH